MCAQIKYPQPVKLFAAILHAPHFDFEEVRKKLIEAAGPVDSELLPFPFTFTDYYSSEMGQTLEKRFISFETLVDPASLVELKISAVAIENQYKMNEKRSVNIDPGYICAAKVVLSTTKDYSHRLYLGKGIYGDVHLQFRKNTFVPNPWTYPDYQEPKVMEFLLHIRSQYMRQLAFARH